MTTKEGTKRDIILTACGVSKVFGSVSQMRRARHRVALNPPGDPDGPCVEHMETGECTWLGEKAGLYLSNTKSSADSETDRVNDGYEQSKTVH